jgi:hypothetical protein
VVLCCLGPYTFQMGKLAHGLHLARCYGATRAHGRLAGEECELSWLLERSAYISKNATMRRRRGPKVSTVDGCAAVGF